MSNVLKSIGNVSIKGWAIMKEKAFSKQIRDDIKAMYPKAHVYLIQDSYRTGRKPYDFFVVHGVDFMAFECKAVQGKTIDVSVVTDRQIASLSEVYCAGDCASPFVIVHSKGYGRVFVFSYLDWKNLLRFCESQKIRTIDLMELDEPASMLFAILDRKRNTVTGKPMWNVDAILG